MVGSVDENTRRYLRGDSDVEDSIRGRKRSSRKPQLVHDVTAIDGDGFSPSRTWANHHATYLAGRAWIDEADALAAGMEEKWGCGRLRLLVPPELRERFDRQRYLFNQAVWHGDLEAVRRESGRMAKAWRALDRTAGEAGHGALPKDVWEIARDDGRVIAIVPDNIRARMVIAEGRHVDVYTLDEIGRLIEGYPLLAKVKETWPGATVTAVRRSVDDPLETVGDTRAPLDDEVPF